MTPALGLKNFVTGPLALLGLAMLVLALGGCRKEENWEPETVALVNGRPIAKASVDRMLELGFYPELDQGGERELTIPMVMLRLIDEELVLDQAEKSGVTATAAEIRAAQESFGSAWFGSDPPPAELAELAQALRRYVILRKMTEKVIERERLLKAADWRDFWSRWPKHRPPDFMVRAILLPPADEPPFVADDYAGSLEQLAEDFKHDGVAALVSQPLKLSGAKLDQAVIAALSDAHAGRRLSAPVRLEESWAVYEVLQMEKGPTARENFKSAREAFEAAEGEKAFRLWLTEVRSRADIRLNPQYQALAGEAGPGDES